MRVWRHAGRDSAGQGGRQWQGAGRAAACLDCGASVCDSDHPGRREHQIGRRNTGRVGHRRRRGWRARRMAQCDAWRIAAVRRVCVASAPLADTTHLTHACMQVSAASLGSLVSKGQAAAGLLESIHSSGGGAGAPTGASEAAVAGGTTVAAAGAASADAGAPSSRSGAGEAAAVADCPRCVQRAQMHLQRAIANGNAGALLVGRPSEN